MRSTERASGDETQTDPAAVGDRSRRRGDRHRADESGVRRVHHRDRVASNGRGGVRGVPRGDCGDRRQPRDRDDGSRGRQPRAPTRRPRWRIRGGAAVLRERLARGRRRQRRVVAEDRLFERTQLRAGLDPELLDERLPAVAVARKRVGLSTVAVEGEHQLPEHPLVERLGRDPALQIGDELVVASESKGHVDALRPGGAPLVVQLRRRRASVPLERDVGERITSPEAERLVERLQRLVELGGDRGARRAKELGEACGIQITGVARDGVPGRAGDDYRRIAKHASEPRHVLVHHVPGARGRLLTPDGIDQRVDRHDLADLEKQDAEQRSLAATRQVHTATVDQRLERAKNPKGDLRQGTNQDRTGATGLPARDGAPMERRWSGFAPSSGPCAHSQPSSPRPSPRPHWPPRLGARRRATPPLNTPSQSRASAPGHCSSITRTTWAREPTRSPWLATSEPRPLDVSPASRLFPSHPSSSTRAAVGSRHNADSRRSMRERGSASTTPSTPLARRHSGPLCLNASTELVHAPDPLTASRRAPRARASRPRLHRRRLRSRPAVTA